MSALAHSYRVPFDAVRLNLTYLFAERSAGVC
jgi:hypothetical protein